MYKSISDILLDLGFDKSACGFAYAPKMLEFGFGKDGVSSEQCYRLVAEFFKTQSESVFDEIKSAIADAAKNGQLERINNYLKRQVFYPNIIYLNTEFLYNLLELLYNNEIFF